jgi:hypothetical protein
MAWNCIKYTRHYRVARKVYESIILFNFRDVKYKKVADVPEMCYFYLGHIF